MSLNLVGNSTGSSEGLLPFNILSTSAPLCFSNLDSLGLDLALCGCGLNMLQQNCTEPRIGINKHRNTASARQNFQNELKALCREFADWHCDGNQQFPGVTVGHR
jgi:hypothetical protein